MIGYILLILAATEVLIGLYLIFRYERSQSTVYYGLFAMSVAIYVGANGLGYTSFTQDDTWPNIFAWIGGAFTAPLILGFSYSYPFNNKRKEELLPIILAPLIFFTALIPFSDTFVKRNVSVSFNDGFKYPIGELFWFVLFVFLVYWVWSFVVLFKKRKVSDSINKNFLNILIIGLLFSLIVSMFTNIFYPLITYSQIGYIGPLMTSIWLLVTTYLMVRK